MEPTIIGVSKNIQRIKELIDQVADTGLNTVVYGETGVGKELVVQNLYQKSNRIGKPFVKVNCAALPDTLLESEMFGYEPGAFTGAERRKRGKFEQANGGLLFLDEIGDMSLPLQSKLLHVLQGGDFSPLGSEKSVKMGAWVIAATNHELETEMVNGEFREDLYYRLSTIKIHIEPLRKRPDDIPYLIDHYVKAYTTQFDGKQLLTPSQKVIEKLTAYHWPGNVRELENTLHRAVLLAVGDEIGADAILAPDGERLDKVRTMPAVAHAALAAEQVTRNLVGRTVAEVERDLILETLKHCLGNRTHAAKLLDISIRTLRNKLNEYNWKNQRPDSPEED